MIRIGKIEGIGENDTILLRTAALFHDSGFLIEYDHNEKMGVLIMKSMLPKFGYTEEQILTIEKMILSTQSDIVPNTLLEQILCDADHDYLGKPEYLTIATRLRKELELKGTCFADPDWIEFQLDYLENKHVYYTKTSKNMRNKGKLLRIIELKKQLELVHQLD